MRKKKLIMVDYVRRTARWVLAMLMLIGAAETVVADEWKKVAVARKPSEVSIWTRYISGQQMKQFRGETYSESSLISALALIQDTDAMPSWLYRCKSARILQQVGYRELYVYLTFSGIWPLQDRDAVLLVVPSYDEKTGSVTLTGTSAPHFLPPRPDMVRVPAIAATFVFEPRENGLLRMELTGHFDAGGAVPTWIANLVVTILPKQSLTAMSDILEGDYFRSEMRIALGKATLRDIQAGR